jgi:hypothetical protein
MLVINYIINPIKKYREQNASDMKQRKIKKLEKDLKLLQGK